MTEIYRLAKSLRQMVRTEGASERAHEVAKITLELTSLCGPFSRGRQALLKIGRTLMQSTTPKVLVPVCLPYGTLDGHIPEMVLKHHIFLERCREIIPIRTVFLLPLQEADDEDLVQANRLTCDEFATRIRLSGERLRDHVGSDSCVVRSMDEELADLRLEEEAARVWIASEPSFALRLQNETLSRNELYDRTMRGAPHTKRLARTIRTAGQYVALGNIASRNGSLILNHTTTNLAWYGKTDVGVLHNPVSLVE